MGFGKDNKGVIIRRRDTLALTTIGGQVAKVVGALAITKDFRLLKLEIAAHVVGLTAGEGRGLTLFLADGELTVAEIKECLEADGPLDRNDNSKSERAERPVWVLAQLDIKDITQVNGTFLNKNGGSIIEAKPRWTFSEAKGYTLGIYNNTSFTLTTGASMQLLSTAFGVWV